MDIQLFEKLRLVEAPAVATEVDLQKEIKDFYKGKSTKLTKSTFGGSESEWYKFWLLTDGTIIPVDHTHRDIVKDATKRYFETDPRTEFLDTGAVAGHINHTELSIQSAKKLNKQQISQLRNIGIEYKITSIFAAIGRNDWESAVKSSKHLDYLLRYGPDVDEAVATEVDPQKQMKAAHKGESTKLALSTWGGTEKYWYKFWLLQDGTMIPVERSHLDTALDAGLYSGKLLLDAGAVRGHIDTQEGHLVKGPREMNIEVIKKLTSQQVSSLKNLYIEYKVKNIVADIGRDSWRQLGIKSSAHLDYLLNYGPDVDEAKEEPEMEKEQFFIELLKVFEE